MEADRMMRSVSRSGNGGHFALPSELNGSDARPLLAQDFDRQFDLDGRRGAGVLRQGGLFTRRFDRILARQVHQTEGAHHRRPHGLRRLIFFISHFISHFPFFIRIGGGGNSAAVLFSVPFLNATKRTNEPISRSLMALAGCAWRFFPISTARPHSSRPDVSRVDR